MFCWLHFWKQWFCVQMLHGTVCALIHYIIIYVRFEFEEKKAHSICPTTKGSLNSCIELAGFSSSKKIENHCFIHFSQLCTLFSVDYFISLIETSHEARGWHGDSAPSSSIFPPCLPATLNHNQLVFCYCLIYVKEHSLELSDANSVMLAKGLSPAF